MTTQQPLSAQTAQFIIERLDTLLTHTTDICSVISKLTFQQIQDYILDVRNRKVVKEETLETERSNAGSGIALSATTTGITISSISLGSITGATNGLKLAGGGKQIGLGSPLTGNTVIAGGGNKSLTLGDTSRFTDFTVSANNSIKHDIYFTATGAVVRDFMDGVGHTQQTVFGSKSGATMYIGYDATAAKFNGFAIYSSNGYPTVTDQKLVIRPNYTQFSGIQVEGTPVLRGNINGENDTTLLAFKNRTGNS